MTTNQLPKGRYQRVNTVSRLALWVGTALTAGLFLWFAVYASFLAKPQASVELSNYAQVDANHIQGTYIGYTGISTATCVFKAYDSEGSVVGYAEAQLPANTPDGKTFSIVVKTILPASVLRADACYVK